MHNPLWRYGLVLALTFCVCQYALAFQHTNYAIDKVRSIDPKILPLETGNTVHSDFFSSKEKSNFLPTYRFDSRVTDKNGNTVFYEDIDSIGICNLGIVQIDFVDTGNDIIDVQWYDENEINVSSNSRLILNDCQTTFYDAVYENTSNVVSTKRIKLSCTDIRISVEEIENPGSGSGVLDFDGDGRFDICIFDTTSITINNLQPDQDISYNWIGSNGFLIEGVNTANPTFYGFQKGNFSVLLLTTNQYGCSRRDQFNFSVNAISDLEIQASILDEQGNLVSSEIVDSVYNNCISTGSLLLSETATSTNGNVSIEWIDEDSLLLGSQAYLEIDINKMTTYQVTVEDEFGCSAAKSAEVVGQPVDINVIDSISGEIIVDFDSDTDLDLCLDFNNPLLVLANNPLDSLSFIWTGDIISGSPNSNSPALNPPVPGNYFLNLTITNQYECSKDLVFEIEIFDYYTSEDIVHQQTCNDLEVEVTLNNMNSNFYSWLFTDHDGSETIIQGENVLFTYSAPGQYPIKLIPNSDLICTADTITKLIDIVDIDDLLEFDVEYLDCSEESLTIQFNDLTIAPTGETNNRKWTFGDGNFSTSANPIITITESGPFMVELEITNSNNCAYSTQKLLKVDFIDSLAMQDTIFSCFGESNVELNTAPLLDVTYLWESNPYFTDVDVSSPSVQLESTTNFNVSISKEFSDYSCSVDKVISAIVFDEILSDVQIDGVPNNRILFEEQSATVYLCAPQAAITLTAGMVENATYNWYQDEITESSNIWFSGRSFTINSEVHDGYELILQVEVGNCKSKLFSVVLKVQEDPEAILSYDYTPSLSCSPSLLKLHADISATPSPITSFNWTGPNGFNSSLQSPELSTSGFENNGEYLLVITNQAGCSSTYSITVNDIVPPILPDPIISSSGLNCEGGTIILTTATQEGMDVDYQWSFPNAMNIIGQGTNQITIYPLDESLHMGDYTVQVVVNECVSSIDTFELKAIVEAFVAEESICQGENLRLILDSPLGISFDWTGPKNFSSQVKNPTIANVNASNNGLYTVVVSNSNGCTSMTEILVDNINPDIERPLLEVEGPICIGDDIILSTTSVAEVYEWIGPLGSNSDTEDIEALTTNVDNTNIDKNSLAYLSGLWKVRITDENGCSAISDPLSIAINELPKSEILGDDSVCENGTLKIYANNVEGAIYEWFLEEPSAATLPLYTSQAIEIENIQAGFYTYYLRVTLDGCPSEISNKSFLIDNAPSVIPEFEFTPSSDCLQSNLRLNVSTNGASPFSYTWTGPNNFSSTEKAPEIFNISNQNLGIYMVQVTDSNGCSNNSFEFEVNNLPMEQESPLIEISGLQCKGEHLELSVNDFGNDVISYTWNTPTEDDIIVDPDTQFLSIPILKDYHAGLYSVDIEFADCTLMSEEINLVIEEIPAVDVELTNEVICVGEDLYIETTGTNIANYAWIGPNGFSSDMQNLLLEEVVTDANGLYELTVYNSLGCSNTTEVLVENIVATDLPIINYTNTCNGAPLILTTEALGSKYEWIPPIGQPSSENFTDELITNIGETIIQSTNLYYLSGEWKVRVTDNNGCISTSAAFDIEVSPSLQLNISGSSNYCKGEDIILSTGFESDLYSWTLLPSDDSGIDKYTKTTEENTLILNSSDEAYLDGDWYLNVDSESACLTESNLISVSIKDKPIAEAIDNGPFCTLSEDLQLSANTIPSASYNWYIGDPENDGTLFSTDQNTTILASNVNINDSYFLIINSETCKSEPGQTKPEYFAKPNANPQIEYNSLTDCAIDQFQLVANGEGIPPITYDWTGPNGYYSNQANPIVQVENIDRSGLYTLIVSDQNGCSNLGQVNVEINEGIATPNLQQNESQICNGLTLVLSLPIYTGQEVSYIWTTPIGTISTANTLDANNLVFENVDEDNEGWYTVTVSVDGCQSNPSEGFYVTVNSSPLVNLESELNACIYGMDEITLNIQIENGVPPYTFQWTGPNNFTSNEASPLLSNLDLSDAGNYTVQVNDANNCQSSISNTILIINKELPIAQAFNNGPFCTLEEELQLSASTLPNASYKWYLGDPDNGGILFSTVQNPSIPAAIVNIGDSYFLTVDQGDCISVPSVTTPIYSEEPQSNPEAEVTFLPNCSLDQLQLSANENNTESNIYEWAGPNGFTSVEANPLILGTDNLDWSGTYRLNITNEYGCESESSLMISIDPPIEIPTIELSKSIYCIGSTLILEASIYNDENANYEWTGPNGIISTDGSNGNQLIIENIEEEDEGLYSVVVISNDCISDASSEVFVEVYENPLLITTSEYNICTSEDNELILSSEVQGGLAPYIYQWSGPDNFTSSEANPILTNIGLESAGVYELMVSDINSCESMSSISSVNVFELPTQPILEVSDVQICEGDAMTLTIQNYNTQLTYFWTMNDGSILESTEPFLTISETQIEVHNGLISVVVSDGLCSSLSSEGVLVSVVPQPTAPEISNTSLVTTPCSDEDVQLISEYFKGAVYMWSGPNDFTSDEQSPFLTSVSPEYSGVYALSININGCISAVGETEVIIGAKPSRPIIINEGPVCEGQEAVLKVQNVDAELLYKWYKSSTLTEVGQGSIFKISNTTQDDEGAYYTIAESPYCYSEASLETILNIESEDDIAAYAGDDSVTCEPDYLLGSFSSFVQEGSWIQENLGNTSIINPDVFQTLAVDLNVGENQFTWNLSNTLCSEDNLDTVVIYYYPYPLAEDDEYTTDLNSIYKGNVVENDLLNTSDYQVIIIDQPSDGAVDIIQDGSFIYTPDENFFGVDSFRYQLCNEFCLEDCVEADVIMRVGEEKDCFIPSVFTPNDDGKNDQFVIPFLSKTDFNKLVVYNRWGDEVFSSPDYKNEWQGTYKGKSLPVGTYYYILEVNDGKETIKTGHVFIHR